MTQERRDSGPFTAAENGIRLQLLVQPRASRNEIVGVQGEALKIRLAAPPVDGAANEELISFLADSLGLPKRSISITQGQSSRRKVVSIAGATVDSVSRILLGGRPGV